MSNRVQQEEQSLIGTVDFRAFFETLRLRWWLIPVLVALSFVFLQAQASDLRTEPMTYVITRGYDIGHPNRALSALGLDLGVIEFPEAVTQLLILGSNETRDRISKRTGKDIEVGLPKDWDAPMIFSCNQPVREDCVQVIEAYVDEASKIRRQAIITGVRNLKTFLVAKQQIDEDPLLEPKIAALSALEKSVEITVVLVNSEEASIGSTVDDVQRPTVLLSAAAGIFFGLLVILQLSISDNRIRSARKLLRLIDITKFLGSTSKRVNALQDRRTALALYRSLSAANANCVRFLPLRESLADETPLERVAVMCGGKHVVAKPFSELSVTELADPTPDEVDVLVVQRNRDLRKDVVEAVVALSRSGRRFAGVLLVD